MGKLKKKRSADDRLFLLACHAKLQAKRGDPRGIFISLWLATPVTGNEWPSESVFYLILLPFSTVKSRSGGLKAVLKAVWKFWGRSLKCLIFDKGETLDNCFTYTMPFGLKLD
jgi:hypothetical protein